LDENHATQIKGIVSSNLAAQASVPENAVIVMLSPGSLKVDATVSGDDARGKILSNQASWSEETTRSMMAIPG
jgi:hypothetical protein